GRGRSPSAASAPRPAGAPRRRLPTRVTAPRPPPGTLTDTPFCSGQVGRRPIPSRARSVDVPFHLSGTYRRSTPWWRDSEAPVPSWGRLGDVPFHFPGTYRRSTPRWRDSGAPFRPGAGWATSRSTLLVRIVDQPCGGWPRASGGLARSCGLARSGGRPCREAWHGREAGPCREAGPVGTAWD